MALPLHMSLGFTSLPSLAILKQEETWRGEREEREDQILGH